MLLPLLATVATPVVAQPIPSAAADAALTQDRYAWDFVEGVEVGPRQAGTEAEKRGRDGRAWLSATGS